jgi:hypothetical protein
MSDVSRRGMQAMRGAVAVAVGRVSGWKCAPSAKLAMAVVAVVAVLGAASTASADPPTLATQTVQDIGPSHAALVALFDNNGVPATYYFEYGTTTAYGASVPATQDGFGGVAAGARRVVQPVYGLLPGTTYHFRLVAMNADGTTTSPDQTFTTTTEPSVSASRPGIPGAGLLPDDRGWEKVSPGDKNGGDVMADSARIRASSDGNAIQFSSLVAFGDALGSGLATDYVSTRNSSGWETHAITPLQKATSAGAISIGLGSGYAGSFSDNLSKGVFLGWSPVTTDPNVENVANLYLRTDLRTPGAGSYALLTACPVCELMSAPLPPAPANTGQGHGQGQPWLAGASADFGHVLFESQEPLTSDVPSGCNNDLSDASQCPPNLYEWDHGTVRLVGILPDSECSGTPPCAANGSRVGASGFSYTPHVISADGSKIFFGVPNDPNTYMRLDHSTTIKLNRSERTDCAGDPTCGGDGIPDPSSDPNGPQGAVYRDASADGKRVFFVSTEALTDDAPADGTNKLYMYDTSKPDSDPHNLTLVSVDAEPADGNANVADVLGASDDGRYVYFDADGQLVAGGRWRSPTGIGSVIYVWHDGAIRDVASIDNGLDGPENTADGRWDFNPSEVRVTPDGKQLLFSSRNPAPGPTGYNQTCANGDVCREYYVYSYDSQRLACATCNPSGAAATNGMSTNVRTNTSGALTTSYRNNPIADDGREVFFTSLDALVSQDINGRSDVYEYDVPTGTFHLISSGRDSSESFFVNASASGRDVFFLTRAQLTSDDTDTSYDLYDARVGGGFPAPVPAPAGCVGEACRGPQSVAPGASVLGNGLVTGDGNVVSKPKAKLKKPKPKPCKRGFVRRKVHGRVRCVKPKRHVAHKARRAKGAVRRSK